MMPKDERWPLCGSADGCYFWVETERDDYCTIHTRRGERRVPLDGGWNELRWPEPGCEPVSAKDERRTEDRRKAE